ncbi:hypothetical protein MNQ98_05930 [Paenibacillus sp. N3/727]|uniref:hypothetical protein n=1 Tax=Paenibacillus sp. N3/727 TaxID=2925845 RepID=UPI001F53CAD6|nr:hypothetical protein [Paenibacillus sp. N3/727]UNK19568.1 hypothetical protein MNQ98_05930 [Paenibacillus sp. N3/727]
MYINNEDLAKQYANDRLQELEQCRLLQEARLLHNEIAASTGGVGKSGGKWRSLLESIMRMGRRML